MGVGDVAVHALQHPEQFAAAGSAGWWTDLHVYVVHGFESAARMWSTASGGPGVTAFAGAPHFTAEPAAVTVTISDVAGPRGDFPASGNTECVDQWAHATYADLLGRPT